MPALKLSSVVTVTLSLAAAPAFANGPKTLPHGPTAHGARPASHGNPHTTTATTTKGAPTIAQKVASKPQLASRVATLIPAGMTLNQASRGFKNQGQFIAALHVSRNLNIPFADLKAAMTGIRPPAAGGTGTGTRTGEPILSLGQAIQKLRPAADATTATATAEREASHDLAPTTTATSPWKRKASTR